MIEVLRQGGVVIYPLGLCSVLILAVAIERIWRYLRADADPQVVIAKARTLFEQATAGDLDSPDTPSWQLVRAALERRSLPREQLTQALSVVLAGHRLRLSSHLGIVGTIGNIAPFIGLFGTVLGIIRAFRDIGQVGAAGPAVVATGIAEALVATAAGLVVAISAVIIYNGLLIWQRRIIARAEIVSTELILLAGEKRQ